MAGIDTQENAMTEIALAMAMGFFSIMILTMISMGIPTMKKVSGEAESISVTTLVKAEPDSGNNTTVGKEDVLIVFDGNAFRDRKLNVVRPETIAPRGRIILALMPGLSLSGALRAQSEFQGSRVILTTLNRAWQAALRDRKNAN